MHDRTEWTRGEGGHGKRKNLVEFARPCVTCGKPFSILVTEKIADGHADSNSFGLKNCEEHRRGSPKAATRILKAELDDLYRRDKTQFAEIQELKARLAAYELFRPAPKPPKDTGPWHATGQPMPRSPADGDWEGD